MNPVALFLLGMAAMIPVVIAAIAVTSVVVRRQLTDPHSMRRHLMNQHAQAFQLALDTHIGTHDASREAALQFLRDYPIERIIKISRLDERGEEPVHLEVVDG